jgi:hypothetical protein
MFVAVSMRTEVTIRRVRVSLSVPWLVFAAATCGFRRAQRAGV